MQLSRTESLVQITKAIAQQLTACAPCLVLSCLDTAQPVCQMNKKFNQTAGQVAHKS